MENKPNKTDKRNISLTENCSINQIKMKSA